MKRPSWESLPSVLLIVFFIFLVPWVFTKSAEPLPKGLQHWKTRRIDSDTPVDLDEPEVNLNILNSTSTYYPKDETGTYWKVSFERAQVQGDGTMEMAKPMVCIIDPKEEYGAMVIRGGEGTSWTDGQFVEIRNNVRTRTYDGDWLETENLCYDAQKNLIYSEGPYVLTRKGNVLRGVGISTDPKMSSIKFGKLKGKLSIADIRKNRSEAAEK